MVLQKNAAVHVFWLNMAQQCSASKSTEKKFALKISATTDICQ